MTKRISEWVFANFASLSTTKETSYFASAFSPPHPFFTDGRPSADLFFGVSGKWRIMSGNKYLENLQNETKANVCAHVGTDTDK